MRRRAITLATTIALLVLMVAGPAMATPPGSDPDLVDGHKITICHVTNSASNPFVVITVDIAAWHEGGEVGHSPEHHVSDKTGLHDDVWDEINGCTEGGGGDPTST